MHPREHVNRCLLVIAELRSVGCFSQICAYSLSDRLRLATKRNRIGCYKVSRLRFDYECDTFLFLSCGWSMPQLPVLFFHQKHQEHQPLHFPPSISYNFNPPLFPILSEDFFHFLPRNLLHFSCLRVLSCFRCEDDKPPGDAKLKCVCAHMCYLYSTLQVCPCASEIRCELFTM